MWLIGRILAALDERHATRTDPRLAALRQRTAGRATGDVLEIGPGTGANLPFYPPDVRLSVVEANSHMVARLQRRAAALRLPLEVKIGRAEDLPYPSRAFDAVVATLVLCSVAEQGLVLAEVHRVLRPGGAFFFLEHVLSDDPAVRRWQRWVSPIRRPFADGCCLDRDTASAIRHGGFASVEIEEAQLPDVSPLARRVILGYAVAGSCHPGISAGGPQPWNRS